MARTRLGANSVEFNGTLGADLELVAQWPNAGGWVADVTTTLRHDLLGVLPAGVAQPRLEILVQDILETPLSGYDWIPTPGRENSAVNVTFRDAVPGLATARVVVRRIFTADL